MNFDAQGRLQPPSHSIKKYYWWNYGESIRRQKLIEILNFINIPEGQNIQTLIQPSFCGASNYFFIFKESIKFRQKYLKKKQVKFVTRFFYWIVSKKSSLFFCQPSWGRKCQVGEMTSQNTWVLRQQNVLALGQPPIGFVSKNLQSRLERKEGGGVKEKKLKKKKILKGKCRGWKV